MKIEYGCEFTQTPSTNLLFKYFDSFNSKGIDNLFEYINNQTHLTSVFGVLFVSKKLSKYCSEIMGLEIERICDYDASSLSDTLFFSKSIFANMNEGLFLGKSKLDSFNTDDIFINNIERSLQYSNQDYFQGLKKADLYKSNITSGEFLSYINNYSIFDDILNSKLKDAISTNLDNPLLVSAHFKTKANINDNIFLRYYKSFSDLYDTQVNLSHNINDLSLSNSLINMKYHKDISFADFINIHIPRDRNSSEYSYIELENINNPLYENDMCDFLTKKNIKVSNGLNLDFIHKNQSKFKYENSILAHVSDKTLLQTNSFFTSKTDKTIKVLESSFANVLDKSLNNKSTLNSVFSPTKDVTKIKNLVAKSNTIDISDRLNMFSLASNQKDIKTNLSFTSSQKSKTKLKLDTLFTSAIKLDINFSKQDAIESFKLTNRNLCKVENFNAHKLNTDASELNYSSMVDSLTHKDTNILDVFNASKNKDNVNLFDIYSGFKGKEDAICDDIQSAILSGQGFSFTDPIQNLKLGKVGLSYLNSIALNKGKDEALKTNILGTIALDKIGLKTDLNRLTIYHKVPKPFNPWENLSVSTINPNLFLNNDLFLYRDFSGLHIFENSFADKLTSGLFTYSTDNNVFKSRNSLLSKSFEIHIEKLKAKIHENKPEFLYKRTKDLQFDKKDLFIKAPVKDLYLDKQSNWVIDEKLSIVPNSSFNIFLDKRNNPLFTTNSKSLIKETFNTQHFKDLITLKSKESYISTDSILKLYKQSSQMTKGSLLSGKRSDFKLSINDFINLKHTKLINVMSANKLDTITTKTFGNFTDNQIKLDRPVFNNLYTDKLIEFNKLSLNMYTDDLTALNVKDKQVNILDSSTGVTLSDKIDTYLIPNLITFDSLDKNTVLNNDIFLNKDSVDALKANIHINLSTAFKPLFSDKTVSIINSRKYANYLSENINLKLHTKNIMNTQWVNLNKAYNDTDLANDLFVLDSDNKNAILNELPISLFKSNLDTQTSSYVKLTKLDYLFNLNNHMINFKQNKQDANMLNDSIIPLQSLYNDIINDDGIINLSADKKSLVEFNTVQNLNHRKIHYSMFEDQLLFKTPYRHTSVSELMVEARKLEKNINKAIKEIFMNNSLRYLKIQDVLTRVSKIEHSVRVLNLIDKINSNPNDVNINEEMLKLITGNKLTVLEFLGIDVEKLDKSMISYETEIDNFISRDKKPTMDTDTTVNLINSKKDTVTGEKQVTMSTSKTASLDGTPFYLKNKQKKASVSESKSLSKQSKDATNSFDDLFLNSDTKQTRLNTNGLNLSKDDKTVAKFKKDIQVSPTTKNVKSLEEVLTVYSNLKDTSKQLDLLIYKAAKELEVANDTVFGFRGDSASLNDTTNMMERLNYELMKMPDIEQVYRDSSIRDIMVFDYELGSIDDEFIKYHAKGVDQLLLPQNDYNYNDIKTSIFDYETGKPINPVKQIDETTFIAKMPVDISVTTGATIGREYLDVNTTVLKFLLEIFYVSWQNKIFEYGTLDIRTGVNKILKHLELFIEYRIPPNIRADADRAYQLIRWYAEETVMNHSTYRITFKYKPWKSNLFNTQINCENINLGFKITDKFVLQNMYPISELTLKLDVKKEGYMTGECRIFKGKLSIYVNDELLSEIDKSGLFKVPTVKGLNSIKFSFNGDMIKLGNIEVENCEFDDIVTVYDKDVGKANYGLDLITKRICAYYDVTSENEEQVKEVIHGALSLKDLTNNLVDYFNKHHYNKEKGIRKTIKKGLM